MLKKVKIKNFLSCTDVELGLDAVTALIGRNAAGKTNILRVIEGCAQFAVGEINSYQLSQLAVLKKEYAECEVEFCIDKVLFKYTVRLLNNLSDENNSLIISEVLCAYENALCLTIASRQDQKFLVHSQSKQVEFKSSLSSSLIPSIFSLVPKESIPPHVEEIFKYLSGIMYYDFDNEKAEDISYIEERHYKNWLSENNQREFSVNKRLLDLRNKGEELRAEDQPLFWEIGELIGENGLNLIDQFMIYEYGDDTKFYVIKFSIGSSVLNYQELSFGTQRVLMILLALLYDDNSTLLIEQPEDGIHADLLRKVLPLCFTYAEYLNKQLIITTHSADIIDILEAQNIRFIKMTSEGTKASKLPAEEMTLIPEYMKNEGSLSEFIDSMDDD